MTRLPPPPDELATKADTGRLEQRFDGLEERFDGLQRRFDRLEDRFGDLFTLMVKQGRNSMITTVSAMTALTAIYGGMLVAFVA